MTHLDHSKKQVANRLRKLTPALPSLKLQELATTHDLVVQGLLLHSYAVLIRECLTKQIGSHQGYADEQILNNQRYLKTDPKSLKQPIWGLS